MVLTLRRTLRAFLLGTNQGYNWYLKRHKWSAGPRPFPSDRGENVVLKTQREWALACKEVDELRLPSHATPAKNWDSLIALRSILTRTDKKARVLDAGATTESVILPWLYIYGYRNLVGINLSIDKPTRWGTIRFEKGDITKTEFHDDSFDAITCLSVVEHGVDLNDYFKEMARILKPGGVLVTSTDYWDTPIDTKMVRAFDASFQVFTTDTARHAIETATRFGLITDDAIDFGTDERAVWWDKAELSYTFLILTHKKN